MAAYGDHVGFYREGYLVAVREVQLRYQNMDPWETVWGLGSRHEADFMRRLNPKPGLGFRV